MVYNNLPSPRPRLAAAVAGNEVIAATDIRRLRIAFQHRTIEYHVDSDFLMEFEIPAVQSTVTLQDRDKSAQQLNDRVSIQKMVRRMRWVCLACLNSIVGIEVSVKMGGISLDRVATCDLRENDVPQGRFNWSIFSTFALTFDPLSEAIDEFNQMPTSATPSETWTAVALRYFLYCWQRIGTSQGGLGPEAIQKVEAALDILRSKV